MVHAEEISNAILKGMRREIESNPSLGIGVINNMEVGRYFDELEFIKRDEAQFYDE